VQGAAVGTVATRRPPGTSTRCVSVSTAGSGVGTCSAIEQVTTSTLASATGSAVASARTNGAAPRARAAASSAAATSTPR
jgi:hypothetical protein